MKFSEYQELSKRTMPENDNMGKSNYALGLNGEAGELGEIVKKHIHHHHPLTEKVTVKFKKEVGDVLHYLAGICTMYGVSLEECATLNIVKLQSERYPNGFSYEDSIKRVDVDETEKA
jgi:NTP pyrophosphatase (non-canonical NTP hydrolase)